MAFSISEHLQSKRKEHYFLPWVAQYLMSEWLKLRLINTMNQ